MKRLIKADYYDEHGFFNQKDNIEEKLIACAKYFANIFGINENTIKIDKFASSTTVAFGSIVEDGYEVSVDVYDKDEINRIIMSAGKNSKGKSIYIETREQSLLDEFLTRGSEFIDWMTNSEAEIERRFG